MHYIRNVSAACLKGAFAIIVILCIFWFCNEIAAIGGLAGPKGADTTNWALAVTRAIGVEYSLDSTSQSKATDIEDIPMVHVTEDPCPQSLVQDEAWVFVQYGLAVQMPKRQDIKTAMFSLRAVRTQRRILLLVTDAAYKEDKDFERLGVEVRVVPYIYSKCKMVAAKHRLEGSWTRFNAMNLTEFRVIVSIDSDLLVLQNIDHLFGALPENVDMGMGPVGDKACKNHSASMNIGVWLLRPSKSLFQAALNMSAQTWYCKQARAAGSQTMITHLAKQLYWDKGGRVLCLENPYNCRPYEFGLRKSFHTCDIRPDVFNRVGNMYVLHWSGETKPWEHWWDASRHEPIKGLNPSQRNSVRLWWIYAKRMKKFLDGPDGKFPHILTSVRGHGRSHVFHAYES